MPRPQSAKDNLLPLPAELREMRRRYALLGIRPEELGYLDRAAALIEAQAEYIAALRYCDCVFEPAHQRRLEAAYIALSKLAEVEQR